LIFDTLVDQLHEITCFPKFLIWWPLSCVLLPYKLMSQPLDLYKSFRQLRLTSIQVFRSDFRVKLFSTIYSIKPFIRSRSCVVLLQPSLMSSYKNPIPVTIGHIIIVATKTIFVVSLVITNPPSHSWTQTDFLVDIYQPCHYWMNCTIVIVRTRFIEGMFKGLIGI
jgi:hypothetical protein